MAVVATENRPKPKSDDDVGLEGVKADTESRSERLREAVREAGGNKVVAQKAGVPISTLGTYLGAGSGMKIEPLIALADATGVKLEWLATGRGPMRPEAPADAILPAERGVTPPGYVSIPRFDVRAAAGHGVKLPSELVIAQLTVSEDYVRRVLRRQPENLVLLEAEGDSMWPTIADGDVMMVDISVRELRGSRPYVLRLDDRLMVKRLHPRLDGSILVKSDNARYPDEVVTPSDRMPLVILGDVIWHGGPLRG